MTGARAPGPRHRAEGGEVAIFAGDVLLELAGMAAAPGPVADRARGMLHALRRLVPFDGVWIARADREGYRSVASADLDPATVRYLSGPRMRHDIEATGAHRPAPPISPSDLSYPAAELATWAECLIPAGINEALAMGLFEPGGRHVGFVALLSGTSVPPTPAARRQLTRVAPLLAEGIDPMRSLAEVTGLVGDAFAGVLLFEDGRPSELPGLPRDDLLGASSDLLRAVGARMIAGEAHMSFLWPGDPAATARRYVRVTCLAADGALLPGPRAIVLLSPARTVHGLTPRELEVLGMIVDGCSNQQIAQRLVVTARTVAAHVEHILAKLSSPSRTHAAVRAQREGLYIPVPAMADAE